MLGTLGEFGVTGGGGVVDLGRRGASEIDSLLVFIGLFGGLPPDDLSKIFRGSLLGFLRRCTKISAS